MTQIEIRELSKKDIIAIETLIDEYKSETRNERDKYERNKVWKAKEKMIESILMKYHDVGGKYCSDPRAQIISNNLHKSAYVLLVYDQAVQIPPYEPMKVRIELKIPLYSDAYPIIEENDALISKDGKFAIVNAGIAHDLNGNFIIGRKVYKIRGRNNNPPVFDWSSLLTFRNRYGCDTAGAFVDRLITMPSFGYLSQIPIAAVIVTGEIQKEVDYAEYRAARVSDRGDER